MVWSPLGEGMLANTAVGANSDQRRMRSAPRGCASQSIKWTGPLIDMLVRGIDSAPFAKRAVLPVLFYRRCSASTMLKALPYRLYSESTTLRALLYTLYRTGSTLNALF